MDRRLRFPGAVWRHAADRAGGDKALDARIVAYVTQLASGETQQAQAARLGSQQLTDEERHDRARKAGQARWRKHQLTQG